MRRTVDGRSLAPRTHVLGALALLVAAAPGRTAEPPIVPWTVVAPGLEAATFPAPVPSDVSDSTIAAVRIDPARFELRILSRKALGLPRSLTAKEWVRQHGLVGAINASMYRDDHVTPVSYMKAGGLVVNDRITKDNVFFACEPRDGTVPAAQIVDRTCQDAGALLEKYRSVAQSIRMIDCQRGNAWKRQPKRWSTACVGTDTHGRVLFLHVRSPYAVHELIAMLVKLPLDLERLMYVEGGPEASLHVELGGKEVLSRVGSYETGFHESDDNDGFWPLPNVIGFAARASD